MAASQGEPHPPAPHLSWLPLSGGGSLWKNQTSLAEPVGLIPEHYQKYLEGLLTHRSQNSHSDCCSRSVEVTGMCMTNKLPAADNNLELISLKHRVPMKVVV